MPEMEKVPGVHLVDRNVPQRRDVEIPHVLLLPIGRPRAIDFGEVVVRAAWLVLERARRPHAGKRPAIEVRRRCDDDGLRIGQRDDALRAEELFELLHLLLRDRQQLPGLRVLLLRATPRIQRVAAIEATGDAAEFLLHRSELAQRDRQQALVR